MKPTRVYPALATSVLLTIAVPSAQAVIVNDPVGDFLGTLVLPSA